MRPWLIFCAAAFVVSAGCGSGTAPQQQAKQTKGGAAAPNAPEPAAAAAGQDRAKGDAAAGGPAPAHPPTPTPRKIIYNADVQLVVTDLDNAESDLRVLLKEVDAFIANSEVRGATGAPRSGRWRVRVPAERFDDFMTELVKLGVPQRNTVESQEVTDEYYDLADRLKNKQVEQERLRAFLQEKKATSTLEEFLAIEKELNRVREEADKLEGRLRRLKDLTALATVTVSMQEVKDYVPPQAPTFGSSVRGTFADSIDLLVRFGQGVAIVAVALAPWLAVLAVIALPGWGLGRRYWKKSHAVATVLPVEDVAGDEGA